MHAFRSTANLAATTPVSAAVQWLCISPQRHRRASLPRQSRGRRLRPDSMIAAEAERKKVLLQAHQIGLVDRDAYETKLRELPQTGPGVALVEAGTRCKGGVMVKDYSGLWKPCKMGYASSKEAMADSRSVTHGDNGGEWRWNTKGCKVRKVCNAHKDCPVMYRAVLAGDRRTWNSEVLDASHSLEPKAYRSAQSALTFEEEAQVKQWVNEGKKPRHMLKEATKAALVKGETRKKTEGGLVGKQSLPCTRAAQHQHLHQQQPQQQSQQPRPQPRQRKHEAHAATAAAGVATRRRLQQQQQQQQQDNMTAERYI